MLWPGLLALALGRGRDLGWQPPTLPTAGLSFSYAVVVALGTAGLALATGMGELSPGAGAGQVAQAWTASFVGSFAGSLFTVLAEEMGWRGFLQRRLEPSGPTRALLGASAVATGYHALAILAPGLSGAGATAVASFLAGVFLLQIAAGLLYRAGGSLWAPFLFHLTWNATNPLLTGNVYLGEKGLVEGTVWLVNGEGLLGAAVSAVLLAPLFFGSRALARRAAAPGSRVTVFWALALVALVAGGAFVTLRGAPEPAAAPARDHRARAEAALEKALEYLEKTREELSLDAVFLLRLVEGALPSTRAGAIAERSLAAAKRDPTYPLFAELVRGPRPPHPRRPLPAFAIDGVPNPRQAFDEPFSDTCLKGALACRFAPGCRTYKTQLGQWGYVLTHQVLFFLFAREKKCAWDLDVDAWIARLSRAMLREHQSDPRFSDLFAERMGLGAYAGYEEFLREEWVREILEAQRPPGCWPWALGEAECSDHATGMSAWVLAMYLRARRAETPSAPIP